MYTLVFASLLKCVSVLVYPSPGGALKTSVGILKLACSNDLKDLA